MDLSQVPFPNMHVYWKDGETVINHRGGWDLTHGGRPTMLPPRSHRDSLRLVSNEFLGRVRARLRGGIGGLFTFLSFGSGLISDYERWDTATDNCRTYEEQMCEDYSDAGPYIDTIFGIVQNPYQGCKGA